MPGIMANDDRVSEVDLAYVLRACRSITRGFALCRSLTWYGDP